MMHGPTLPRLLVLGCLVTIAACGAGWAQDYYDNVVIVLDGSGSMASPMRSTGTQKMTAAKLALKEVIKQVPESTRIGLLVFSAKNVEDEWVYPLGTRDDQALAAAIDFPKPGGDTPLGKFIKIGADRLLEERQKQFGYASYRLLVVTDGEATDGLVMERHVPEVIARGITVDVIGVDMKQDHTLATKVHSYRRADDPAALTQALAEVLAEVAESDTDAASEEAFDLLAPVPIEMGVAMVAALSETNNRPIGASAPAARPVPAPRPRPSAPPAPRARQSDRGFQLWWIAGVILLFVVLSIATRLRRRP